jgi:hypothetical protein
VEYAVSPEVRLGLKTPVILVRRLEITSTRPLHHAFSQKKSRLAQESLHLPIYLDRHQSFGAKEYVCSKGHGSVGNDSVLVPKFDLVRRQLFVLAQASVLALVSL